MLGTVKMSNRSKLMLIQFGSNLALFILVVPVFLYTFIASFGSLRYTVYLKVHFFLLTVRLFY